MTESDFHKFNLWSELAVALAVEIDFAVGEVLRYSTPVYGYLWPLIRYVGRRRKINHEKTA